MYSYSPFFPFCVLLGSNKSFRIVQLIFEEERESSFFYDNFNYYVKIMCILTYPTLMVGTRVNILGMYIVYIKFNNNIYYLTCEASFVIKTKIHM